MVKLKYIQHLVFTLQKGLQSFQIVSTYVLGLSFGLKLY
jgi:hypothetical protein